MVIVEKTLSQKLSDQAYDYRQKNAGDDHRSDWKIESEVFSLHPYIAGEAANPVELVVEEIDYSSNEHHCQSGQNNIFTGLLIHNALFRMIIRIIKAINFIPNSVMRKLRWWMMIPLLLVIGYLLGPEPASSRYNTRLPPVPADPAGISQYINTKEARHKIKPDNHARILWADDSARNKTEYSIVYLHGFTASYAEGEPVHRNIAKKFNCNLFLARLAEHGIDTTEPMQQLTVDKYWESVKEALAIGRRIGSKVIVMGTSTGGSLALKLAAEYRDIHALVLLSPNIEINDGSAWILNNPWGLQLANLILGSKYIHAKDTRPIYQQYWISRYRIEAAVALQELLETSMTVETFRKVSQPVLMLYYYRDEVHQDSTVRVSAMKKMFSQLGTPSAAKVEVAMPNAGNHVIASYIKSNDVAGVEKRIEYFLKNILKIPMANRREFEF